MISPINTQQTMLNSMLEMQKTVSTGLDLASSQMSGFKGEFVQVMRSVSDQQTFAADMMAAVDAGRSNDVVGAMVASQKADLSFSMLLQMRNKVMNGLDDVMRMSL
jgi:flagellar hook-basal body complex protein FliE